MLITEMPVYLLGKQTEMKEDGWGTGLLFFSQYNAKTQ